MGHTCLALVTGVSHGAHALAQVALAPILAHDVGAGACNNEKGSICILEGHPRSHCPTRMAMAMAIHITPNLSGNINSAGGEFES